MKRACTHLSILSLLLILNIATSASSNPQYHRHRILVKFKSNSILPAQFRTLLQTQKVEDYLLLTTQSIKADIADFVNSFGIVKIKALRLTIESNLLPGGIERIFYFELDSSVTVETTIKKLNSHPDIEYAEPDYIGHGSGQLPVVKLSVYDLLGREVVVLVNSPQTSGNHQVIFNGRNLASGIYIYRLETNNIRLSKRLLLLK